MEYQPRSTAVHKSLHEVKTIGGVEDKLAILNVTFTAAFVMGMTMWQLIPVGIMAHLFLAWLTKKDPWTRKVYMRYSVQADMYDPWPHAVQKRGHRPVGFARGALF